MNFSDHIFTISSKKEFEKWAMKIFRYQYENNHIYKKYCDLIQRNPLTVKSIDSLPFLPIQFFKQEKIISNQDIIQEVFSSSGTTGQITSKHYITDLSVYEQSYSQGFQQFYGNIENYCVLALLPSYQEREGSSLIYMVNDLIDKSNHVDSGFYLHQDDKLAQKLTQLDDKGQNVILIGVSYALLDLIEKHSFNLKNTIIMETGGMKGRRKELIRKELHAILCKGFGVSKIHSEYGMTELLSQAYSFGNGFFECPSWMKIMVRDTEDPLTLIDDEKTGGINVIDLANFNSCSFIATQDLGKKYTDQSFEILGRFDHTDIRGCNLMVI